MQGRLSCIEALRGFAALSVALFHFTGTLQTPALKFFSTYAWLGVDVFFIISGFVIPYSLWGRRHSVRDFPRYMARRIVRLEPPYLATIALFIGLWWLSTLAPGF